MDYSVKVDKYHPISEDYFKDLVLVPIVTDTEGRECFVEKKTYEAYLSLRACLLEKESIEIGIDSAYRDIETQVRIMREFTEKYGEEYAKATVATPGTSEHHTGLALDICPRINGEWIVENDDMLALPDIFARIHAHLSEFGFVLSYPKGSLEATGFDYEPWHIRYFE